MPTAKKVQVYEATAPFDFNGEQYAEGDEFALPPGYEAAEDPLTGRLFIYTERKVGMDGKNPAMAGFREFLPVKEK